MVRYNDDIEYYNTPNRQQYNFFRIILPTTDSDDKGVSNMHFDLFAQTSNSSFIEHRIVTDEIFRDDMTTKVSIEDYKDRLLTDAAIESYSPGLLFNRKDYENLSKKIDRKTEY